MLPLYLEQLNINGILQKSEELNDMMNECKICPNECGVNRFNNESGKCHSSNEIFISSYGPHYGEEPPLVGSFGSGTIFFTNCTLNCIYCQNYDISHLGRGEKVTPEQLSEIMLNLQKRGCHNINLVSPTHYIAGIVIALSLAVEKGLEIPLVYNTGGYESTITLKILENIVYIYMTYIKYSVDETAEKYSGVSNYWTLVKNAFLEMHRQTGDLKISRRGVAQRGLLIRHLVLPNKLAGSKEIIKFISQEISKDTYLNIMPQYRPAYNAYKYQELNRSITSEEFNETIQYAKDSGLYRGIEDE